MNEHIKYFNDRDYDVEVLFTEYIDPCNTLNAENDLK